MVGYKFSSYITFHSLKLFKLKIIFIFSYCSIFSDVIIQHNTKGYSSDFQRDWSDYKAGFGSINGKTYWKGLDAIHDLTKTGAYSLEIRLKKDGQTIAATWSSFSVASESNKFRLSVSGFNAGYYEQVDYLKDSNGMYFSTRDRDNDEWPISCSTDNGGRRGGYSGWWFWEFHTSCSQGNLNWGDSKGPQFSGYNDESTMILKR